MKRKVLSPKDDIEGKFVNKITSLFPHQIVKVILFGSRAKGVPRPGSDYDFLIVLKDKERKIIDAIYDVVTDFLIQYGVDISLKVYKEKDFQEWTSIPTPFMASILKTGKELWTQKSKI
jgi:predicted nucleotidyltransferase